MLQRKGADAFDYGSVSGLDKAGAAAGRTKSLLYALAFNMAVQEQGSRPSDKDIQNSLDRIGASTINPHSFREILRGHFKHSYERQMLAIGLREGITPEQRATLRKQLTDSYEAFQGSYRDDALGTGGLSPEEEERRKRILGEL